MVGNAFYVRIGGWESQGDGFLYGVDTDTAGDSCDELYGIGAGLGVGGGGVVVVAACTVTEVPMSCLNAFTAAHGVDAVHGDGAEVVEREIELAVVDGHHAVEQAHRVARAGKGAHGELTCGIVDKGKVAVIGNVIVGGDIDAL